MSPWSLAVFVAAMIVASLLGDQVRARIPPGTPVRPLVLAASLALFAAAFVAGFGSSLSLVLVVVMAFLASVAGVFSGPWGRS